MLPIKEQIKQLKELNSFFKSLDQSPAEGCLETGVYSSFQCCYYHKKVLDIQTRMVQIALEISKEIFPSFYRSEALADSKLIYIDGILMSVLSPYWWELIEKTKDESTSPEI